VVLQGKATLFLSAAKALGQYRTAPRKSQGRLQGKKRTEDCDCGSPLLLLLLLLLCSACLPAAGRTLRKCVASLSSRMGCMSTSLTTVLMSLPLKPSVR
jgi:hypothetical protein